MAPRTRSRASRTEASPRPTIVSPGKPGATSTSTRMTRPSRPTSVADRRLASTARIWAAALIRRSPPRDGSGGRDPGGCAGGVDLFGEPRDLLRQGRIRPGVVERLAAVLGRDRHSVVVDDLRLELPLEGVLRGA